MISPIRGHGGKMYASIPINEKGIASTTMAWDPGTN